MYVRFSLRGKVMTAVAASFVASAASVAAPVHATDSSELSAIRAEVARHHDETVKRLQDWIAQGILVREAQPSLYAYFQEFEVRNLQEKVQ